MKLDNGINGMAVMGQRKLNVQCRKFHNKLWELFVFLYLEVSTLEEY